ncbi:MAG: alpha/beta hydrolase fold domain-containing protein [Acidobacteria bacterium]|nr:alpha/beta hydrolase fold domain-containing protein [Acidobacteriota bacterium]
MNLKAILTGRGFRIGALVLSAVMCAACAHERPPEAEAAAAPPAQSRLAVDPDGTVHVPAMAVPVSDFMSPEGKAYIVDHLHTLRTPVRMVFSDALGAPVFLQDFVDRQKILFPVTLTKTQIAGVPVYDYSPAGGVTAGNENRVLINLHGGGFSNCWPACAELESMPVSALGGFRVVSPEYRESPEYKFPAASEDVAAVYTELLKSYPAGNIGLFGCSAGGMLTGMSLAWFQAHGLPTPGAAGIYCAGAAPSVSGFGGDASFTATAIGEGRFFAPPSGAAAQTPPRSRMEYLSEADLNDPLVSPATSDAVLSKFPPTQIISGTRSFDLSTAVYTHSRLVALGVEADLHVWEGMFHGFYTNPDVPESREAYNVMVKFFDTHLGRLPAKHPDTN